MISTAAAPRVTTLGNAWIRSDVCPGWACALSAAVDGRCGKSPHRPPGPPSLPATPSPWRHRALRPSGRRTLVPHEECHCSGRTSPRPPGRLRVGQRGGRAPARRPRPAGRLGHRVGDPRGCRFLQLPSRRAGGTAARRTVDRPGRRWTPDRVHVRRTAHPGSALQDLAGHAEGDRRHRGQPLLRPRRDRPQGPAARRRQQPGQRRQRAGRLDADAAVHQAAHPGAGRHERRRRRPGRGPAQGLHAQAQGDPDGDLPGEEEDQARDPRGLPQHRELR